MVVSQLAFISTLEALATQLGRLLAIMEGLAGKRTPGTLSLQPRFACMCA
jgi:hypothetical protein